MPRSCLEFRRLRIQNLYFPFFFFFNLLRSDASGQLSLRTPISELQLNYKPKLRYSDTLLFVAPQRRSWKILDFIRATICGATHTLVGNVSLKTGYYLWRHKIPESATIYGATNTLVGNGWLQTRYYLWRHKDVRGKYLTLDALLFMAPHARQWEMFGFRRCTVCGATNTIVQTRYYLWRHKVVRGK